MTPWAGTLVDAQEPAGGVALVVAQKGVVDLRGLGEQVGAGTAGLAYPPR